MDLNVPRSLRHGSKMRSFNGCWTCRLRRKKCDEKRPVCDTCSTLHITCHYDEEKPEWMDGGVRQEEMAERLKLEVKENRHRGDYAARISSVSVTEVNAGELHVVLDTPIHDRLKATANTHDELMEPCPITPHRGTDRTFTGKTHRNSTAFSRSDTVLLMFYLEYLVPFLFPFYRPSLLEGGKAWILELMMSSPVVRQTTLCSSSYFFSLTRGTSPADVVWETVLTQSRDAFEILRQALKILDDSNIAEHVHCAVRVMASIMQVQRFDIAVLSFNNCQAHLNAALALFRQLLDGPGTAKQAGLSSSFNTVMNLLGPSSFILPAQYVQVPSAEQAAFHFSSTLLMLDDIVASTVLQKQPRLYECHHSLLGGTNPLINFEAIVGCQNWALIQIGEIAVLDAWKQQCIRAGNLDVMEVVHRAKAIKDLLECQLNQLENDPVVSSKEISSLLDAFTTDERVRPETSTSQTYSVTRVWAHAALVYLFVIVSGWQPANMEVQYHIDQIVELLTHQISPPALLRTMVWPFCVAGCLAEPAQEAHFRAMAEALQPPSVFGTVRKALEIMENVWRNRNAGNTTSRDLATCFRSQGDLVLLV